MDRLTAPKLFNFLVILTVEIKFSIGIFNTVNVSNCSTSDNNRILLPNCTVISPLEFKSECVGDFEIKVWLLSDTADSTSHVHCVSDNYMTVQAIFQDGAPSRNLKESYVHLERFSQDLNIKNLNAENVNATYKYSVKLYPKYPYIVRYLISNGQEKDDQFVSVMFFYGAWEDGAAWMTNYHEIPSIFEVNQESVIIPCVPEENYKPDMLKIVHYPDTKNERLENLTVDNKTITYEPSSGFAFNTTAMADYNDHLYRCLPMESNNLEWDFEIKNPPYLKATPQMSQNGQPIRLFVSSEINKIPFKLECNYIFPIKLDGTLKFNTIQYAEWFINSYTSDEFNVDDLMKKDVDIQNDVKYRNQSLPKHRFIATYENQLNIFNNLIVDCVNKSNGIILYSWNVSVHDTQKTSTDTEYLKFDYPTEKKYSRSKQDFEFMCSSQVYRDIRLRTIRCSNVFQCRLLQNCFKTEYSRCGDVYTEGSKCPDSIVPDKSCQNGRTTEPGGITLCTAGGYEYFVTHIVGLDDIIYNFDGNRIPTDAVIRLNYDKTIKKFYTNTSYTFACTVHQFYSEGQIHFLFEYYDEDNFEILPGTTSQNASHEKPYSATIYFVMKSAGLIRISCRAPTLYSSTKWEYSTTTYLSVIETVSPEILTDNFTREYEQDGVDQSIVCNVSGVPPPGIDWFVHDKIIQESGIVNGDSSIQAFNGSNNTKILNFKKFHKGQEGKYICRASNTSKDFRVVLRKDSRPILKGAIAFSVVIMLMLLIIICRCFLIDKKRKPVMDEVKLDWFHKGKVNPPYSTIDGVTVAETLFFNLNDYLNLPFKEEFKIQKKEIQFLGILWIVMECCEFGSLKDYFDKYRSYFQYSLPTSNKNSHYGLQGGSTSFGFVELLRWSEEIALGMEFLSSKKVIHRDLAARNILLDENRIAKISDFGLSENKYKNINSDESKSEVLVKPYRWMALECFEFSEFTTESDVWSYGITIWEIFDLGMQDPYPNSVWINSTEWANQLRHHKLRNEKPRHATMKIYEIMLNCWNEVPNQRPSFANLANFFSKVSNK